MIDFNKTLRCEKVVLCPLEFDDFNAIRDLRQEEEWAPLKLKRNLTLIHENL